MRAAGRYLDLIHSSAQAESTSRSSSPLIKIAPESGASSASTKWSNDIHN